jgi:hypothetical protein
MDLLRVAPFNLVGVKKELDACLLHESVQRGNSGARFDSDLHSCGIRKADVWLNNQGKKNRSGSVDSPLCYFVLTHGTVDGEVICPEFMIANSYHCTHIDALECLFRYSKGLSKQGGNDFQRVNRLGSEAAHIISHK